MSVVYSVAVYYSCGHWRLTTVRIRPAMGQDIKHDFPCQLCERNAKAKAWAAACTLAGKSN